MKKLKRTQFLYQVIYSFVTAHDPVPEYDVTWVWADDTFDAQRVFDTIANKPLKSGCANFRTYKVVQIDLRLNLPKEKDIKSL